MSLQQTDLENHPYILPCLRERARQLLALHESNPRSAGIFATHQRWLLAHISLAAHFENARAAGRPGMHAALVAQRAQEADVASRNTAEAFLREMQAYGFMKAEVDASDQRVRRLVISPHAMADVAAWAVGNLATLDAFDSGRRAENFKAAPEALAVLQPVAASAFLTTQVIRRPGAAFALFDAVDEGGALMDRLISTCADEPSDDGRRVTGMAAVADFGENVRLSRTHLTRKLREAEALGALGWTGARGRSPIWISASFVADYIRRQAAELAAIEAGFEAAFGVSPVKEGASLVGT